MSWLEQYRGKKVLITGHTGFKGSWLSLWLHQLGAEVTGVSIDIPTEPAFFSPGPWEGMVRHLELDVRNHTSLKQCFDKLKPDYVFHLAAQAIVSTSYRDPLGTFSTNVMGVANILECAREAEHPCSVVVITSDKCYDNVEWEWGYRENDPLGGKDIYSGSKGGAELVFKSYFHSFLSNHQHIRCGSARAGNVIGGGDWAADRIVPDTFRAWSQGEKVSIRSPKATRPWQHVLEPLSGYLQLGAELISRSELSGESYNFGPSAAQNATVETLIQDLEGHWRGDVAGMDIDPSHAMAGKEARLLKLNCDKALFDLNWVPTLSYSDVVRLTGDWYSKYYVDQGDVIELAKEQIAFFEEKSKSKTHSS